MPFLPDRARLPAAFIAGALVGCLGGLIGLGGAEFRLPLLLGFFEFPPLAGVILNKAMSLVVVTAALPFRAATVPWPDVLAAWPIVVNLLAGSLLGAWYGASLATRLSPAALKRTLAVLLLAMAAALLLAHHPTASRAAASLSIARILTGIATGFGIGVIAAFMGVAGGELLIPTLVLLYSVPLKLAGSLSLVVSLPTMLVGFARYSQDRSFAVLRANANFAATMACGSLFGSFVGGQLLGVIPEAMLLPSLSGILALSAAKLWRQKAARPAAQQAHEAAEARRPSSHH